MKLTDKVSVSSQAVARTVGQDTIILDLQSGMYFGLDPIGARIWQLMEDERALSEICDTLLGEFEVERSRLEADILKLAQDLLDKKLIDCP